MSCLKRILLIIICVGIIGTSALFCLEYRHMTEMLYREEIGTMQAVAGAILPEHPELETAFVDALRKREGEKKAQGAQVLKKYGYSEQRKILDNHTYHDMVRNVTVQTIVFASVFMLLILFLFAIFYMEKERTQKEILEVAEQYLSGNYQFAFSSEKLKRKEATSSLGQIYDILKKLGNRIKLKDEKIQEDAERTKALVTDISHQLKTPIAALKLCFSMYQEANSEEERVEFFQRSIRQIEQLESLTGALVNISRLETAMIQLTLKGESLQEILTDAVSGIYFKAQKKGIVIETSPFQDRRLYLDKKWTAEAIMNVLDNAIKYSPAESCITIHVQEMVSFIRIEIADEGIGVPEEEYNKIFWRFYRGADREVKQMEGAGVGLYLTRSILEKQGGSIMVKKNLDKGSTFILQLPK